MEEHIEYGKLYLTYQNDERKKWNKCERIGLGTRTSKQIKEHFNKFK